MYHLFVYALLIFSSTTYAMHKASAVVPMLQSGMIIKTTSPYMPRRHNIFWGFLAGYLMGKAWNNDDDKACISSKLAYRYGYKHGFLEGKQQQEIEQLQTYLQLISKQKSTPFEEFNQTLKQKAQESSVPLNTQLSDIQEKLDSFWVRRKTKEELHIKKREIQELLKDLDRLK